MADRFQPSSSDSGNMDSRLNQSGVTHNVPVGEKRKGKKRRDKKDKTDMAWVEGVDDTSRPRISIKSLAILVLGSLAATATIAVMLKSQPNAADQAPTPPAVLGIDDIANSPPVFTQPPREIADAFLASADAKERLPWVRNPKDVAKRMNLYPEEALNHAVEKLTPLGSASVQNMVFARFVAKFPNGNKRLLCVLATDDGPKVDWDAYARYGSASWESILQGTAGPAEVRVFLKRGYYYTYNYRDDTIWQCYKVISPDTQEPIYVYARSDSQRGKLLAATFLGRRSRNQRMTLTISSSEGGHKHGQFTIDRVHSIGWVRANKDIEDVWISSPLNKPKRKASGRPDLGRRVE